ncbi:hypothetical protein ACLOJK_011236 [Asimina triloba]
MSTKKTAIKRSKHTIEAMEGSASQEIWASAIPDILVQIFSKLDLDSLLAAASVCHSWRRVDHFPECWDFIHLSHWEQFLGNRIKETHIPDYRRLRRESDLIIRHAGDKAKLLFAPPGADDATVQMIVDRCPSIESLSLRDSYKISPASLLHLICTCKHLRLVDLRRCWLPSASMIEEMGESCKNLVGLNLGGWRLTQEMATAVGKSMPKLKWLSINDATVSSDALCSILDSCTELQYLSVVRSHQLNMNDAVRSRASRISQFNYSQFPRSAACRLILPVPVRRR